jgi:tetratricopeptide (TPR) repeat protein
MRESFYRKLCYYTGLLPLGAVFGLVAYMATIEVKDLDLWLHLATGKFITLHHFVPSVDILSNSIAGKPWNNHEWLFQVIVYNIFTHWGVTGLLNMQVMVVLGTMLLLLFLGYNKERQLFVSLMLFLVYLVYHQRFTIRPDLFSLLFFATYIFVLALHIDKKWSVWVLVIVQILWSNMHGFFFFGPLFVLIGIISEWSKRHVALPDEWNQAGRLSDSEYRRLCWIMGWVVLACVVNPQGIKGAVYPLGVFFSLGGGNKIFFEHIQELQKPIPSWSVLFNANEYIHYKLLMLLSVVSFILNRRRIDISALLFWLVFLIFSLEAVRNLSFFAIASYLVVITNSLSIDFEEIVPLRFLSKKIKYLTLTILQLFLLLWIFQHADFMAARGYYDFEKYEQKSEFGGITLRGYPNKAVDFLEKNNIEGNFFNDFNSGAYLLGRTFPKIKVFIDGRTEVYGADFFKKYQAIWVDGNAEIFEEAVKKYNLTGALLNSSRHHLPSKFLNYLYTNKDWVVVYFDDDGIIFLRKGPQHQDTIDRFAINLKDWQVEKADLFKLGATPVKPYQYLFRAFTLETIGLDEQALAEAQEALRVAPDYADPYAVLGKVYAKQKNFEKAFESFRLATMYAPGNKRHRMNLALAYDDLGQDEGAAKQYNIVINRWPNDPQAYFLLAKVHAQSGQYQEAVNALGQGFRLDPQAVKDVMDIADIVFKKKEFKKVKEMYNLLLQAHTAPAEAYKKLGLIAQEEGDNAHAQEYFQKASTLEAQKKEKTTKSAPPKP